MKDTLFDPYNLYKPCDDSNVKAFNSQPPSFCQSAHEVQKDDREAKDAAVQNMIQVFKKHIAKGN